MGGNDVAQLESAQLAHSDARVGEETDDQLVPLGRRYELELVDLVARQDLDDALGEAWELRLARTRLFTLVPAPRQELTDHSDVVVDRVPGQLLASLTRHFEQV